MPCLTGIKDLPILKKAVLDMIVERENIFKNSFSKTSLFWTSSPEVVEGLQGFLNSFTTGLLSKIRLQSSYITGGKYALDALSSQKKMILNLWGFYTKNIPLQFCISEPLFHDGSYFGIFVEGKLVNMDTIRYQACITNLYLQGIFDKKDYFIIMEVGTGFGGLSYSFEQLPLKFSYFLVDVPEILQQAAAYLMVNSKKRIYIYDVTTFPSILREFKDYDFILLPNYVLPQLQQLPQIDLFINQASFQEMTEEQVITYLDFAKTKATFLYSDNVDRHIGNAELTTNISKLLEDRFLLFPTTNAYLSTIKADTKGCQYFAASKNSEVRFKEIRLYDGRTITPEMKTDAKVL